MQEIWRTQQLHLECIQDPPGVQLYRNTGQGTKDGVILPSYRYARGSTSLESFHLHLNRQKKQSLVLFESVPLHQFHPSHGELIGVEYLYSQTSRAFEEDIGVDPDIPDGIREEDLQVDLEGDEGFEDICLDEPIEFMEFEGTDLRPLQEQTAALHSPGLSSSQTVSVAESSSPALSTQSQMESVGPDGQAGYDHVIRLANSLVGLRHQRFVSQCKVDEIVMLWNNLSDHDKGRLIYPPCHCDRQLKGRFKVSHLKANVTPGTESLKSSLYFGYNHHNRSRNQCYSWPSTSRVGEAVCLALCRTYPAGQTIAVLRVNRWAAIIRDYRQRRSALYARYAREVRIGSDYRIIRDIVLGSPGIMARTKLKLFELNQLTISRWHNDLQGGSGLHQPGRIHRTFEEHFAADPDTPDELRDEDQEGDEGFEDLSFDEPLGFGAHLQCVFISFDAQEESVGPDGQAGYDHVIKLANRLVELCHQGFVTQEKVDEIVTLWENPSEHGMGRVPLVPVLVTGYPEPTRSRPPWEVSGGFGL
ncbi:unnamed protein product [Leuciscus chuanchicus]